MKRLLLFMAMSLIGQVAYGTDGVLPPDGFKAEQEGHWDTAAVIYGQALQNDPQRLDLWLRLAEIHAHLKQFGKTAEDLDHATRLRPQDASLWKKLSEARAQAGDKDGAFSAVDEALKLDPSNPDYLRAHAQLAVWSGHNEAAIADYNQMLEQSPDDAEARLWLARIESWNGQTDAAAKAYRTYLAKHPDDKDARMELIKVETWRGNYAVALDELGEYRTRFGEDRAYLEQRARSLAWLGKSQPALEIAQRLLADTPEDVEVLTTRLIAYSQANQIDEALADLKTIQKLRPEAKETRTLERYLLTPLRSSATFGANYSSDSDHLHILRMTLEGEYVLNTRTRLLAGVERQQLDAPIGSGLENIDGTDNADYNRVWVGVKHRFSPIVAADLRVGGANADGNHQFTEYRAGLDMRLSDDWLLRPEFEHDLYAVSPRADSLHIERDSSRLNVRWTPGTRYTVDTVLRYDNLSDGNHRWEVSIAPRRSFLRTQRVNMDIGLSGTWFGFDKDLNNGYYDPSDYQRYAITSFTYWKLSENDGISLAVSLGAQKDNSMPTYKFGGDAVVQGFFGIYRDWYLQIYGSLLHNVQASSGAYRSNIFGFNLTRRF